MSEPATPTLAERITAFRERVNAYTVQRLDVPPAGAVVARAFAVPSEAALEPGWNTLAATNVDDPACAGAPLGMTVQRDTRNTTITVYWATEPSA